MDKDQKRENVSEIL